MIFVPVPMCHAHSYTVSSILLPHFKQSNKASHVMKRE